MLRFIFALLLVSASLPAAKNLEIYVIDVEGGKSVLFVAPSGESLLFDAGWPASNNRSGSADRIGEAVHAAGLKRIDSLVISHYDIDHIGDVPELVSKIPVGHIYDHGDIEQPNAQSGQRFALYRSVRDRIGHTVLNPGERIPLGGVDVLVLASAGRTIEKPLPRAGTANPLCGVYPEAAVLPTDFEDNQSVGLLISWGKFRMLDLADLEAHYSRALVCPRDLIGRVDVYNVNVHGQFKGIAPELTGTLHAPVMIQANGTRKGADAQSWPILRAAPGLKDIWQLHESLNTNGSNPPPDFIANIEPSDRFKWIQISATRNGAFTVLNSRNGLSKTYRRALRLN